MKSGLFAKLSLLVVLAIVAVACATSPTTSPATQAPPPAQATDATQAPQPTQASANAPTSAPTQAPTANAAPKPGGTLHVVMPGTVDRLDPALAFTFVEWMIVTTETHQGLMKYDFDDKLKTDLAESYQVSPDGKVYTFKIHQGVKFQNGRELVAADFKYSTERMAVPDLASWGQGYTSNIVGADNVIAGKAKTMSGIEVVDKYTIKFTLKQPQSTFLSFLAASPFFVVPKEEVDKWKDQFSLHAVGTGPFMIKEWLPGNKLTLVKNPYYWEEGKPYMDSIEFTMGVDAQTSLLKVEKGEADIIADLLAPSVVQQAMSDPKWKPYIYTRSGFIPTWVWINSKNPPLDKLEVRQAIEYAIDTSKLTKLLTGVGEPLYGIYAKGAPGYDAKFRPYTYDPEKAKQLLAKAGLPNGFNIDFYYTDEVSFWELIPAPIQQDLAKVGIQMKINKITAAAKNEKAAAKTLPLHIGGWGPATIDSADWIGSLFTCAVKDQATGYASYCNQKVDDLFQQTQATTDETQRSSLFRQIEDLVMADAPMIPIINVQYFVLVNPRVKGYSSHLLVPPVNPWVWLSDGK